MHFSTQHAGTGRGASRLFISQLRFLSLIALIATLVVGSNPVSAAEGEAERSKERQALLEEVIVTARRKEESLQDVPVTVNAVTSEDLRELNIRELEDLQSVVAGLTLEASAIAPNASLRGVRFDAFASGNNPTVQFYLNDAPIGSLVAVQALFDIGQIEVLRGPQGTLRGVAAPSGAIAISTQGPDLEEIGGYVDTTVTNKGGRNAKAAVNLPIIENKLGFRLAGLFEENEGNGIGSINSSESTEIETDGYRASLRFEPIDTLLIDAMHQRIRPERIEFVQVESANREDPDEPPPSQGPISPDDRLGASHFPPTVRQVFDRTSLNVSWEVAGLQLEYIGALTDLLSKRRNADDTGAFFGPDADPRLRNLGQEFELNGDDEAHELRLQTSAGKFDYVFGGLYQSSDTTVDLIQQTPVFLPELLGGGLLVVANTPVDVESKFTEKSIYGNGTWHMSGATEFSAGLRYIDFENSQLVNVMGSPIADNAGDWNEVIYMLSVKHRFSGDLMAYATLGSSWRPGVDVIGNFNTQRTAREESFLSLDPETSDSLEFGIKSDLLDRRLRLNGAVFFQQFDNFVYRDADDGVFYVSTNSQGTESVEQFNFVAAVPVDVFGVEVEAVYQATERWSIGGLYSWSQGLIDDGTIPCNDYFPTDGEPDSGGGEPSAAQIRSSTGGDNVAACDVDFRANFAPLWTAALRSEYLFPLLGTDAFARGLVTVFGDSKNDPINELDDVDRYATLDLFAGIRDPDGKWEVTLFGKNITETERVLSRNANPASISFVRFNPITMTAEGDRGVSTYRPISVTAPREIGLNFRYNF